MIKNKLYLYISFFLFPIVLIGQVNYSHSGYGIATTVNRLSDGTIIKLPYRMLTHEGVINYNNFNLVTSSALEFHLKNEINKSKLNIDVRELYLEWFSEFGDFSLGKQIISWGSVSENNPTDNISPYNYYYLFSIGKERKEGILSFNSNFYFNDMRINTIFIPKPIPNLLPLNDPEFAISSPIIPKDEQIMNLNKPYGEYGLSLNFPIGLTDLTFSYFSGYDKIVSLFGANVWSNQAFTTITADTVLSYRKTNVLGLGSSTLIRDFIFKTDFGFFNTYDNIEKKDELKRPYQAGEKLIIDDCLEKNADLPDWAEQKNCNNEPVLKEILKLDNSVKYFQSNIEVEFSPNSNLRIITQYLNQTNLEFGKADSLTLSTETVLLDPEELFISGLGAPNTFISTNSLSILIQKLFPAKNLNLRYTGLFDLDGYGALNEIGLEYEVNSNTYMLVALNKIIADNKIDMNPFTSMENFSHFRIELKYYY